MALFTCSLENFKLLVRIFQPQFSKVAIKVWINKRFRFLSKTNSLWNFNRFCRKNSAGKKLEQKINWVFLVVQQKKLKLMKLNYDISHFLEHKITLGTVQNGIIILLLFLLVANFITTIIVTTRKKRQHKLWQRNFLCQHLFCLLILVSLHFFSV